MSIRAIIVDDDTYAIESLQWILKSFPEIEIIGVFTDPKECIDVIRDQKPEIVFLDIRMPGMSGFDVLDQIGNDPMEVIFVTGYDQYAIQALRYSALDYLLKPVKEADMAEALSRFRARSERILTQSRLLSLQKNLNSSEEDHELVLTSKSEGEKKFKIADIIRCEADSNYCTIHLQGGKRFIASKTLGDLESMLNPTRFIRIHKSHLVNKAFIRHVNRQLEMELTDQTILPISKRRIQEVRQFMGE